MMYFWNHFQKISAVISKFSKFQIFSIPNPNSRRVKETSASRSTSTRRRRRRGWTPTLLASTRSATPTDYQLNRYTHADELVKYLLRGLTYHLTSTTTDDQPAHHLLMKCCRQEFIKDRRMSMRTGFHFLWNPSKRPQKNGRQQRKHNYQRTFMVETWEG